MSDKTSLIDDNYWFQSKQIGYNFNFNDCEDGESTESVHCGGFEELAEKINTSPDTFTPSLAVTENAPLLPKSSLSLELKKPVETSIKERFLQPNETTRNLFKGEPYFLEQYKSKDEKLLLLDSAIRLHDGNGITAAVLFLEKTLKPSIFHQILKERPVAVSHYLNYLRVQQKNVELLDMLVLLQKFEDAAMIQYKSAISTQQAEQKIRNLQRCWKNHFKQDQSLSLYSDLVQEYIRLLEMQLPIEEEDSRMEREKRNPAFQRLPRSATLLNMPVVTTLYYCCLYHYDLPENHLASPLYIKKVFQLSNKQFIWTALAALSKTERWTEIDKLFQSKSWLGGTKLRCCIGFDKAVDLLHSLNTPMEIVTKYLRLVDNIEVRLDLAKKYKCEQLVIDTLVSMGDRQELESYREKLVPHSKSYIYLQEALKASTIKWKN